MRFNVVGHIAYMHDHGPLGTLRLHIRIIFDLSYLCVNAALNAHELALSDLSAHRRHTQFRHTNGANAIAGAECEGDATE